MSSQNDASSSSDLLSEELKVESKAIPEQSSSSEEENDNDIKIDADEMNEFFFLDSEGE
jgi:hypothetical protein